MRPLTAREQRLTAVGLLMLAISVAYLAIVGPLVGGFFDRAAEKRALRVSFARNERLIASLPALRSLADEQRLSVGRFAVIAPNASTASEALKQRLQNEATDEGFAVRAIEDVQGDGPNDTIVVRADLTLTLAQLSETLRRLQNEGAYVVVDYTSISADRALLAQRLAPLDVRLEFSAAWRPSNGRT